jgi:hypothetical protein
VTAIDHKKNVCSLIKAPFNLISIGPHLRRNQFSADTSTLELNYRRAARRSLSPAHRCRTRCWGPQ